MKKRAKTETNRVRGKTLALAALLVVCAAWIVFDDLFAPLERAAVSVEIPDFCGVREDALESADWMTVEKDYRYDAGVEAGVVLSQSPPAGSRRKLSAQNPQCRITLTVSLGEEHAEIPTVVGKDFREAESILRGLGFAVEIQKSEGAYPAGTVFAVSPREGCEVPVGTRVQLSVSAGLPLKSVTVPDLRGLSRSDALVQIWLAELAVAGVIEEPSFETEGTVIRQSHQPGTLVPAGTKLTLYVSRMTEE